MIVEDGVRLRAVDGAGRRRNRGAEDAGEEEARQGATGHVIHSCRFELFSVYAASPTQE